MHPVIQHIIERKEKHGPFHDHRKIALILPGGLMTAVRGAGAGFALIELGLIDSFNQIYTSSAGFPNAAYFLTRNLDAIKIYSEDVSNKNFLNVARFWDIVDIEYLMHIIREIRPLDYKKLSLSKTQLFVRLLDIETNRAVYKRINEREPTEIERILRAAISIPFLNPGSIEINGKHYKDAGSNYEKLESAVREVIETEATDILIIYNTNQQFEHMKKMGFKDSQRFFQITPYSEENLGHFCQDPQMLKYAAEEMGTMVKNIFGDDTSLVL